MILAWVCLFNLVSTYLPVCWNGCGPYAETTTTTYICYEVIYNHLPGSKSWHSEAVSPSLAELAIPSTYWGRGWLPYVQKVLCSEGSMLRKYLFKRFYVHKVLYSEGPMFWRFYVQKVLYSEGPMFRRSYVQKKIVQKVLYSEGSMFRRSYIQIYSEGPIFRKLFVLCRKKHTSFSFDL